MYVEHTLYVGIYVPRGDQPSKLQFDQRAMREHIKCFEQQKLTAFPQTKDAVEMSKMKHHYIHLYCKCLLPEGYDRRMVKCDTCEKWYHFKCMNLTRKPRSKVWFCSSNCKKSYQ